MRASADGSETVDAQWWTPREACERALLDPSDPRFIILFVCAQATRLTRPDIRLRSAVDGLH